MVELTGMDTSINVPAVDAVLVSVSGRRYPVVRGIPRFVFTQDQSQIQTSVSFGYKWKKRDTYDSPASKAHACQWYLTKYGFDSLREWVTFLETHEAVLDVGCGSGFSSSLFLDSPWWTGRTAWVGIDISEAIDVAFERLAHVPNTHFVQGDALALPFKSETFDAIFSEGVLHHTPSTRDAILEAARVLQPAGEFHFYVYRLKGPIREFTDDFVRAQIANLTDEEAWDRMRSLTKLGEALVKLQTSITVEDVPMLGIKAGTYDVQRLLYNNFAKLFWNAGLSFEENVHINFDWYRPVYAHRQTAEEVRAWCAAAGLQISRLYEDDSGITVRATKA